VEIRKALVAFLLGSLLACSKEGREVDEIPGLKLAESVTAVQDDVFNDPDVTTWRPAIRIMQDGGVWTDGSHSCNPDGTLQLAQPRVRFGGTVPNPWPSDRQLYDPEEPDGWEGVRESLAGSSHMMARGGWDGTPAPKKDPNSLPADAVLIRADESSPFYYTQKILLSGSYKGIQIWKYQLATSGGKVLRVYLPKDLGVDGVVDPVTGKLLNSVEVTIKVKNEGNKLDESGVRPYDPSRDMRFIYDDTRDVTYHVGPRSYRDLEELEQRLRSIHEEYNIPIGSIDARPGTLTQEAVNVFDRLILAGFEGIAIVGSYED